MLPTNFGNPNDATTARLVQEIAVVINDVESRLAAVKVGLAQAAPHLAPTLLRGVQGVSPYGLGIGASVAPPFGSFGQPGFGLGIGPGVPPTLGMPGFAPSFPQGVPQGFGPTGFVPNLGVGQGAPGFGQGFPTGVPFGSFR